MENLFGKEDSGNESDMIDVTIPKENYDIETSEMSIKIEEHEVKEELNSSGAEQNSDVEQSTSNEFHETIKTEISVIAKSDHVIINDNDMDISHNDDLFNNDIVLPHTMPTIIKERRESKEKNKKELEEEEREKMQVLVSNFTEDQLDRYEMYRRAAFPKAAIKRIMQTITGCSVSQNVVIAMSGIAKVFIGEIVEEALDVAEAHKEPGPLQPKHLREAVRRLRLQGQIPTGKTRKAFLRL